MRSILSDSCAIGSCDEKKKFSSICGFRSTNVATKPKRSTVSTTKNQWSQESPADSTLRRCFFPITVADCASVNGQTGDLPQPSKPRNPEHYANPCRYTQKTVEQEHERELANAQSAAAKRTPFATVIRETRAARPSPDSALSTARSSRRSWRDAPWLHQGLCRTHAMPGVAATSPSTGPDVLSGRPGGRDLHW